jgi:hypothetical protein
MPVIEDSTTTALPDTLLAAYVRVDSVQWANSDTVITIENLTEPGTEHLSWTPPHPLEFLDRGDTVWFPEGDMVDPPDGIRTVVAKGKWQTNFEHQSPDSLMEWTYFVIQIHEEEDGTGVGSLESKPMIKIVSVVPNPFNPDTRVIFSLPDPMIVTAEVVSVEGRVIRTLVEDRMFDGGTNELHWSGTNERGEQVASGVYFIRLTTPIGQVVKGCLLLK